MPSARREHEENLSKIVRDVEWEEDEASAGELGDWSFSSQLPQTSDSLTIILNARTTKKNLDLLLSQNISDIDIVVNYDGRISVPIVRALLALCTPTASRWRSLSVQGVWDGDDRTSTVSDELGEFMKQHRLSLPRLRELRLCNFYNEETIRVGTTDWVPSTTDFVGILPWEAPNLFALRSFQHVPPPSFPIADFSVFELYLVPLEDEIYSQVENLGSFLASKQNVCDLILKMDRIEFDAEEILHFPVSVFPAITSLQYHLLNVDTDIVRQLYGPILKSMRIPNVQNYELSAELSSPTDVSAVLSFAPYLRLLLPDSRHHPLLTTVTIDIHFLADLEYLTSHEVRSTVIHIPLADIPYASSLRLKTFGQVFFSGKPGAGPSALREVQFRSCSGMTIQGLRLAVYSLKIAGAWDLLERVVIRGCKLLDRDGALEVIGEERLRFVEY
ncbi:hypothetical protein SCHPADRAFT_895217 [Schizopora paradoxa]|uniref:F-box domain-containing protein n=1 Tax=Schizopora paradoxa TaxID=27342 RepID=A0A0H2R4F5_9AGAM|nr:hypothetical protein SCHPADRAFT_895217 [Schizopora paradoxa]